MRALLAVLTIVALYATLAPLAPLTADAAQGRQPDAGQGAQAAPEQGVYTQVAADGVLLLQDAMFSLRMADGSVVPLTSSGTELEINPRTGQARDTASLEDQMTQLVGQPVRVAGVLTRSRSPLGEGRMGGSFDTGPIIVVMAIEPLR